VIISEGAKTSQLKKTITKNTTQFTSILLGVINNKENCRKLVQSCTHLNVHHFMFHSRNVEVSKSDFGITVDDQMRDNVGVTVCTM